MKKTLLFAIAFIGAITFGFAQTSISYEAAGATSQTFTVGQQASDDLGADIALITSTTGVVASSNPAIGLAAEDITDNDVTGTLTFTLTTDSASPINTDLTLDIGKRSGITTAGTVDVTGYPQLSFSFGSDGAETGTVGKLIEFGEISLSETAVTVTITLTSMVHVESTQTGIFRLENVIVAEAAVVTTPNEVSYNVDTAGVQTFSVGQETSDDLGAEIATITSATGSVATNNNFIGLTAADNTDDGVTGTFTFTMTTNSTTPINSTLNLEVAKRGGVSVTGKVSVTSYADQSFSYASDGITTGGASPAIDLQYGTVVSLVAGSPLTVTITLESMTNDVNTVAPIFRLANVMLEKDGAILATDDFELNNTVITMYPNPVSNSFQIDSSIDIENVKLYNITGKLLKTFNKAANYDISDLATGIYIANIKTLTGSKAVKVVKE